MRFIDASDEQKGAIWERHRKDQRAKVLRSERKYRGMLASAEFKLNRLECERECSNEAIGSGADRRMVRHIAEQQAEVASIKKIMVEAGIEV